MPHVSSFDIDEATPPPAQARSLPIAAGRASTRPLPGRVYAPPASYPALAVSVPEPEAPQLNLPPTIDFSDSVRTLVPPIKEFAPPRWLTISLLVTAVVGGAVLGNLATRDQVTRVIATAAEAHQKRTQPPAAEVPPPHAPPTAGAPPPPETTARDEAPPPAPPRAAPGRAAAAARGHVRAPAGHGKPVLRHKAPAAHKKPAQRH
jgi:hypothetical protein